MNQNYYRPVLLSALNESTYNGSIWIPQELLDVLTEQENAIQYVANWNSKCNRLYDILQKDFDFPHKGKYGYHILESEHKKLTELLRWLRKEIENFKFNDDVKLVAILFVATHLADGRIIWREIVFRKRPNTFLKKITWLLGRFSFQLSTQGQDAPIWETEAATAFQKANESGDFVHIESAWQQISAIFMSNFLQKNAAIFLSYHHFDNLLKNSHSIKDIVVATHTIGDLPVNKMLILATMSNSIYIKFGALLVICHGHGRRVGKKISKTSEKLLTDLILSISKNENYWQQFITAFNRYPSRYPLLHSSLGCALANMKETHWKTYLLSFDGTNSYDRKSVSECLQAFHETAIDGNGKNFFALVYEKWDKEIMLNDGENHHFDIFATPLDFGVVAYLIEKNDLQFINNKVIEVRQKIDNLPHEWHLSHTEAISAYNKFLSILQVYYHAARVITEGRRILFEKFFVPQDIDENRYLSLSYPSHWHNGF